MKQGPMTLVAATALGLSAISGCALADDGYFMSRHPNIEAADFNAQQAIERMRAAQLRMSTTWAATRDLRSS